MPAGALQDPPTRPYGSRSTAEDVVRGLDLTGQTILVTGCSSGLGFETMRVLASRGARVVGAARTPEGAQAACQRIAGEAVPLACDLAEPQSVLAAVAQVSSRHGPLQAIIANAGIMALPRLELVHGYERQFFTNHVGHHLLVTRLLPQLAADGRVVVLSSSAQRAAPREGIQFDNLDGSRGYAAWTAYGQSKLANLLFVRHLSTRLPSPRQAAIAVHPGVIRTRLHRNLPPVARRLFGLAAPFLKSAQQGAASPTWAAAHPAAAGLNGAYVVDCAPQRPKGHAADAGLAAKLWTETERILEQVC
ncbi:MAG: SDR family NAD(P)-dependent oxidoreductase [Candidatus Thermoplasmatota archaeon]